jgi:membrane-bound inhibitor of C-type lysozyme
MKLTGYKLRRLVESVLYEADEPKDQGGGRTLTISKTVASDNKKAMLVKNDEDLKNLMKALGTKYSGPYYIWSESEGAGIGDNNLKNAGSFYKKGAGDPYTYEKVSGDKYRVISGPLNKGKYKSGKTIGARPIGATFTMKTAPDPIPPPEPPYDPEPEIAKIVDEAGFNCSRPDSIKQYKDVLGWAFIKGLEGEGGMNPVEGLVSTVTMLKSKPQDIDKRNTQWAYLFSDQCPGDYNKAVKVLEKVCDLMDSKGIKNAKGGHFGLEQESKPISKVKGQASTKNEGLSRGSLYRKRYYGRY